jgi:hypothetical protein
MINESRFLDSTTAAVNRAWGRRASTTPRGQVVWARSTKLGCASVACNDRQGMFIVCEYDPPGNVPGMLPYAG